MMSMRIAGCVKFGYIAANDSIAINMSYGGRLLESDTLKRKTWIIFTFFIFLYFLSFVR